MNSKLVEFWARIFDSGRACDPHGDPQGLLTVEEREEYHKIISKALGEHRLRGCVLERMCAGDAGLSARYDAAAEETRARVFQREVEAKCREYDRR